MSNQVPSQVYTQGTGTSNTSGFITILSDLAPAPTQYHYPIGQRWVDTATSSEYILTNLVSSDGVISANWLSLGSGASGPLNTLTANNTLVNPTSGNINIDSVANQVSLTTTGSTINIGLSSSMIAPGTLQITNGLTLSTGEGALISSSGGVVSSIIGTPGYVLTANSGSPPSFQALPSAAPLTITPVSTASYTVLSTDQFLAVNTSALEITILLPNTTTTGRIIYVKDSSGNASANDITVTTVGGTVTIDNSTSVLISTNFECLTVIFDGTNYEVIST